MRTSPSWLTCDEHGTGEWPLAYAMWCLGHNLSTAGFGATEYALGRAHGDFEALRKKVTPVVTFPSTPREKVTKPQPHHIPRYKSGMHVVKRN